MTVPTNPIYGPLPPRTQPIDVHVGELKQLFNSIDAAPFRERHCCIRRRLPEPCVKVIIPSAVVSEFSVRRFARGA